ncbi:MAG: hypothetical protein K0B81_00940 [Candidatus Cloacimonetes bacterium]|nr:hypothetical protein [Candidatus Cloacimonadota bacterium]
MNEIVGILLILPIAVAIIFCIYFIFKVIQFVLVSVKLYKKMVKRQDAMIKILLDIRDQTKQFTQEDLDNETEEVLEENSDEYQPDNSTEANKIDESITFCYHCGN